jgi:chromosome segregation ATPase
MATGKPAGAAQSIEQLQKRYGELNKKQIEANANLQNAEKQLHALQAEAREKYGSDDLNELRQKLATMIAENESKRHDYQQKLDAIESDLAQVEEKFAAAEASSAFAKGQ